MVTLTGGPFFDATGTKPVAKGTLRLVLNQDARQSGGQVCRAYTVNIALDANGNIATNTALSGNDELQPSGTYYNVTVFDTNGAIVYGPVQWSLTGGGTINVNSINPSTGVPSPAVTFNGIFDSLTLDRANQDIVLSRASAATLQLGTGQSLNPQTDGQSLGSALKRWITNVKNIILYGSTSGSTTLQPSATASGVLTLPAATDQLVGRATTDTLTNKTIGAGGLAGLSVHAVAPGSGTFTIPAGVTSLKVWVLGAGGSGGGATNTTQGGGGGAGGLAIKWLTGLTPGNTLTVSIGAGGAAASGVGNTGGSTTVSSGTQTITTITGNGGQGGSSGTGVQNGGTGGGASGGDANANFNGNSGGATWAVNLGGAGAGSFFGGGSPISGGVGQTAQTVGAGSSGAGGGAANSSQVGGNGYVLIEWFS